MSHPPRRLGRYQLLERIGTGGMAEVYRARRLDESGERPKDYAIKLLSEELSDDPLLVSMFVDEARLASQLSHPSIVQLVEYGADEAGRVFMVMEYIDGHDLRWCLTMAARAQYWLPVEFSLTVARELARALHYAHEAKGSDGHDLMIVHRDVSHSNVFLSKRGEVKLADFGIARARGRQSKTRTGLVKGKLGYLSPEQVRAERLDGRSDIFAASVVLWELLTQRRMFVGETEFHTMLAVCKDERIPPSRFRTGLPEPIDRVVLTGVEVRREDRFANGREMERAIDTVAGELKLRLGPRIIADVVEYLEECARAWAPEEAARRSLLPAQKSSPEEILANLDVGVDVHVDDEAVTPIAEQLANFPHPTDTPSDEFATPWSKPQRTGSGASDPGEEDSSRMAELIARDRRISANEPIRPMPSFEERLRAALASSPDTPFYVASRGQTSTVTTLEGLVTAVDPRLTAPDAALSGDGRRWMPIAEFANLAELEHATMLREVQEPVAKGETNGIGMVGLLGDLALNAFTGRLVVDRDGDRSACLLEAGGLVGLVSSKAAQQLGAALVAARVLADGRQLSRALHTVIATGKTLEEVVVAGFDAQAAHVVLLRQGLAKEILQDMLGLGQVAFAYEKTPGWAGRSFLSGTALGLVAQATATAWPDNAVDRALADRMARRMTISVGLPLIARMLRLGPEAEPVLRQLKPGATLSQVIGHFAQDGAMTRMARRLVLIFAETGAIGFE